MAFDKIFADFALEPASITAQLMGADAVETAAIVDGNITTAKIADLAVTAGKLAANSVETAKIADLAVTAGKLAADAVETAKILNLAVTTDKLGDLAVTEAKLAAGAVTNDKILDGTINIAKVDGGFKAAVLNAFYRVIQAQTAHVALVGDAFTMDLSNQAGGPMVGLTGAGADGVIGVLDYGTKNKVFLRTHSNDPILDSSGREIYGRLSSVADFDGAGAGTDGGFRVAFYVDLDGVETVASIPAASNGTNVHVVYRSRYTADTVPEEYGSGEIFATGVQDVTESSNIAQLAKDLGVALSGTGAQSLVKPIVLKLNDHVAGSADKHAAEHVTFSSLVAGLTESADVKAALEAVQGNLATHIGMAADAHDASAISISAALQTAIGAATADVEAALSKLDTDLDTVISDLSAHIGLAVDAHDASAISFDNAPTGMVATTAQAAIVELDSRTDSLEGAVANLQAKDWVLNPVITATADQTVFALDVGVTKDLPVNLAAIIVTIAGVEQFNFTRNADGRGITFDSGVALNQKVRIRFYA